MKVSWADVGYTETAGRFTLPDGGTVAIKHRHISIWKEQPTAVFSVSVLSTKNHGTRYALGGYDVP
jgi:hypothetical protein